MCDRYSRNVDIDDIIKSWDALKWPDDYIHDLPVHHRASFNSRPFRFPFRASKKAAARSSSPVIAAAPGS
jgi:hypothetical protein